MVDLWRDFWMRETGTGQQLAQLHEIYDDDNDDDDITLEKLNFCPEYIYLFSYGAYSEKRLFLI